MPYQWGANVLMYNTDVFKGKAPDLSVVFEEQTFPDGESNTGRVQAYDGAIYIADAALYLRATQPDLGIEDPYALTQEQFDAAIELVRQQRELVGATGTTRTCRSRTSSTARPSPAAPGRSR